MYGSYRGYYKNNIIHSSYEYIMCKILEYDNLDYKTQLNTYQLQNKKYTPDIFVYVNGELNRIIEIRGQRLNLEERKSDIKEVFDIYKIKIDLITETDLKECCKERNISYYKLKMEWRLSKDTYLNCNKNNFNPMFNKQQSNSTKTLISEKAKERMKNKDYRDKIIFQLVDYNKKTNFSGARKLRVPRFEIKCLYCNKIFQVTNFQFKTRKYCSLECSSKHTIFLAREKRSNLVKAKHEEIRKVVLDWADKNKESVNNIKLNKISRDLKELLETINNKTKVIDWRTITLAAFNVKTRKEFINELKNYINKNPSHD